MDGSTLPAPVAPHEAPLDPHPTEPVRRASAGRTPIRTATASFSTRTLSWSRLVLLGLAACLLSSACTGSSSNETDEPGTETSDDTETSDETENSLDGESITPRPTELAEIEPRDFPPAPQVPDGPLDPPVAAAAIDVAESIVIEVDPESFDPFSIDEPSIDTEALDALVASGDARLGWLISDLQRFARTRGEAQPLNEAAEALTGVELEEEFSFREFTDILIAWDLPAFPSYTEAKRLIFEGTDPRWEFVFSDPDSEIDQRWLSWGGVFIDDRPLGSDEPCERGCIPALDDPEVTPASEGDWYPDEAFVFGVSINDEHRAYPKNIMEVHEMTNDSLGGRRFGLPYCTLCGSAQLWFTDSVPDSVDTPVLRTSGLLSRSNKVMYDLETRSVFDTFTGEALSGDLLDIELTLEQGTVVTTTWGEWKAAHPDTTIVAADGGIGREYPLDPLDGRDDDGPIFPIGGFDDQLAVQEPVIGVTLDGTSDGAAVAFPVVTATAALAADTPVTFDLDGTQVQLSEDGGGFRAATADGTELAVHEAFWFAWSQFHPSTEVWRP